MRSQKSGNVKILKYGAVICHFKAPKESNDVKSDKLKEVFTKSVLAKKWKGTITLTQDNVKIKSVNNYFNRHFKYTDVKMLYSPTDNTSQMMLTLEDTEIYYFILQFKDSDQISKLVEVMDQKKNYDPSRHAQSNSRQISTDTYPNSEEQTNGERETQPTSGYMQDNHHNHIEERVHPKQSGLGRHFIFNTEEQHPSFSSDEEEDEIDEEDLNGRWIEEITYIEYQPSLGQNVASETGSVYMYTAHQLVSNNGSYYSDSDSD